MSSSFFGGGDMTGIQYYFCHERCFKNTILTDHIFFTWCWKIRFLISKFCLELCLLSAKLYYLSINIYPHRPYFMMASSRTDQCEFARFRLFL